MTYIPGTVTPYANTDGSVFGIFGQMIKATGGLTLAQVCSITGLEGSTMQNWVKRGFVANPVKKRYYERQLARILMISALRESMLIEDIVAILKYLNGSVEDESDDAISETRLFDYFCMVTRDLSLSEGISRDRIEENIQNATRGFTGNHSDSALKLHKALAVMCYAYMASLYRHECDLSLKLL